MSKSTKFAYQKYLSSDHWKRLRSSVLWRDEHQCVRCGSRKKLQVHHKVYRDKWEDGQPDDLATLCRRCHRKEHGLYKPQPQHKRRKRKKEIKQKNSGIPDRITTLRYFFGDKPVSFSTSRISLTQK